jgi:hypothetical protein
MTTTKTPASKAHQAVFPANGMTHCTCGKPTVKTYAGWKRHHTAEMNKINATQEQREHGI